MATKKKLLQAAAGSAGGGGLNVEEVFSTYLYNGTATNVSHQIQNGIDLAGEGGLVWIKKRDSNISNTNHHLVDTERGDYYLASNSTNAQASGSDINTFNSDGWTFDASTGLGTDYLAAQSYASWTFRKAPKFFDVVYVTGTSAGGNTVSHNLGTTPGFMVSKRVSATSEWYTWHKDIPNNALRLNRTNDTSAVTSPELVWGNGSSIVQPTDTELTFYSSGGDYVIYLFAHNDGDGEFGPDGDADIIKCGSFSASSAGYVDLGFEPQWFIYKRTDNTSNWAILDAMRGFYSDADGTRFINANTSDAENDSGNIRLTSNGFYHGALNGTWVYIAIRRGPMAVPESATDVFDVQTAGNLSGLYSTSTGFTPDTAFYRDRDSTQNNIIQARLTETQLITNSTASEFTSYNSHLAGNQDGIRFDTTQNYGSSIIYQWKRAPNYFDAVCYTGDGTAGRTVSHNLGAAPEMMWVKRRNTSSDWAVYHSATGNTDRLELNNAGPASSVLWWNNTTPTDSVFSLGSSSVVNTSGDTYIAYLFASLDGVSKVGSYTGNGSLTGPSIDCGFSAGPRFVLIKRTDSAENWYVFDSERGIVAGADPYLMLNSTAAEINAGDIIDPTSSGFQLATNGSIANASGGTYIFYAIAQSDQDNNQTHMKGSI